MPAIFSKVKTLGLIAFGTASSIFCFKDRYRFAIKCTRGVSMLPTFSEKKKIIFLRGYSSYFDKIERGDVISLDAPDEDICIGKRIVGLPGDIIEPRNCNCRVIVPPNHFWVEGDNSRGSRDSNAFGPVPFELIRAKRIAVLWPSKERQMVNHALRDEMKRRVSRRKDATDWETIPTEHLSFWGNYFRI